VALEQERETRSLVDRAYLRLKAAIHTGQFQPGTRLREVELGEWLGISRTPIREALNRLESEGMIEAAPRGGRVVTGLDQQRMSEIYAVRDVLEGLAAELAAEHASSAELATLRALLDQQAQTPATDAIALAQQNTAFHDVIYRAARNRYLVIVLRSLENASALLPVPGTTHSVPLPGTTYNFPGRAESALAQHRQLVDALEARDAARAGKIAREHIREAERIRLLMLSGTGAPGQAPAVDGPLARPHAE